MQIKAQDTGQQKKSCLLSNIRNKWKNRNRGSFRQWVGKLSNGLMIPIAVLPIAGIFLGVGDAIAGNAGDLTGLRYFGLFIKNGGDVVFANLPILFAIAIAITFSQDAGVAGFSAFVFWAAMNGFMSSLILPFDKAGKIITDTSTPIAGFKVLYYKSVPVHAIATTLGLRTLSTSVFGGIIVGALTSVLYKKFYAIRLPDVIGFFSGTRFVPIICFVVAIPVALILLMIWPAVSIGLNAIGTGLGFLGGKGYGANSLIFGYIERSLIPFGVHHAFYAPLWYTSAGGSLQEIVNQQVWIRPDFHLSDNYVARVIGWVDPNNSSMYIIPGALNGQNGSSTGNTMSKDLNGALSAYMSKESTAFLTWKDLVDGLTFKGNFDKMAENGLLDGSNKIWLGLNGSGILGKKLLLSDGNVYTITFKTFANTTPIAWSKGAQAVLPLNASSTIVNNPTALAAATQSNNNTNNIKLYPVNSFRVAVESLNPAQYSQGKFPFMLFGIPAAGVAMILAAPKDRRKEAASIVGSAAFTSFLTGITEPFEFTFLFLAPWLFYGVHAVLAAVSFWLMNILGANVGQTFSGSFIDFILYGALPDGRRWLANSYLVPIIGLFLAAIYFPTFYFLIKHFNLATPGRGGKLITKKEYLASKAAAKAEGVSGVAENFTQTQIEAGILLQAYGGKENIVELGACITKLRVTVKNPELVKEEPIKELGAAGVMRTTPTFFVAVFGTRAAVYKSAMQDIIQGKVNWEALQKVINTDQLAVEPKETTPPKEVMPVVQDEIVILSPVNGTLKSLNQVPDETFKQKLVGEGVAIVPSDGHFKAPGEAGVKTELAFPGGHAYIFDIDGIKVMLHIGIDTVQINAKKQPGEPLEVFDIKTKQGEYTKEKSESVVEVDLKKLSKKYNPITPFVVMKESLENFKLVPIRQRGEIKVGQPIFKLVYKKSQA
ncbi:glucose-specific PTS IICBA transporter [Mycoplasmoides pneumoniae]|uniref:Glucose-specific phosphotransferase enzyme IIA component n=3 Tax=Mycoplasmoides pneumoniae TaxID=2104 RepID=A0AAV5N858_MYCPM|nr:PTS transporter subunit IIABC [Mycoplasmoides pneumoniae]ADK87057.1 putative PTS system glucose-specific EIICBA component [Mycoplasmoides pneumoniae FH]AGC04132.1 PTS glucose transporter subunit IIA [Mycoplasmoides pneumoniae M129-B7]ALA31047.1 PTS glucose transporter subunit IIA [Mycoplasmoides pneumoniae 19294]ALA31488.1 PTS glucose transporter subunit IIA [Mycoplasmoides pneumoniae 39443]ALA35721.1 PTS glucose transporter subunit IIA [Mycoplasmoides pneumoniae FH]